MFLESQSKLLSSFYIWTKWKGQVRLYMVCFPLFLDLPVQRISSFWYQCLRWKSLQMNPCLPSSEALLWHLPILSDSTLALRFLYFLHLLLPQHECCLLLLSALIFSHAGSEARIMSLLRCARFCPGSLQYLCTEEREQCRGPDTSSAQSQH